MMIKFTTRLLVLCSTLFFLPAAPAQDGGLRKLWETSGFSNPESVVYDKTNGVLYVSNVNGAADAKDGNGFISKVSPEGKILKLDWVTGLNGPKGLALHGNKLYAADIDTLVEIDIPAATISNRYQASDAKFLNDVTASDNGDIYVSDMAGNRIYVLKDGVFSTWLESAELQSPNGLMIQGDTLYAGAWGVMTDGFATKVPGHLKKISLTGKTITSIGTGAPVGNLDGVEMDSQGDFYITDWMAGKLLHITQAGDVKELLVLQQGMADLEYIVEQDLILIPMMMGNKLLAYKVQ